MDLRILDINAWHGLYARTWWKAERLEPAGQKERREQALVAAIRELAPDIVTLQECFAQPGFTKRLAAALDMDSVAQVSNAGLRLLGTGFPAGIETGEGSSILARKGLSLRFLGNKNLSGTGFTSAVASFQVVQKRMAVAAEIVVSGKPLAVVTGHVRYEWASQQELDEGWRALARAGLVPEAPDDALLRTVRGNMAVRDAEIEVFAGWIERLSANCPVVVAADMNVDDRSPQLERFRSALGLTSVLSVKGCERPTWDPEKNPNIAASSAWAHADGSPKDPVSLLSAQHDRLAQRPDHVFLGKTFGERAILEARVVLDEPKEGVVPSDHFGILAKFRFD